MLLLRSLLLTFAILSVFVLANGALLTRIDLSAKTEIRDMRSEGTLVIMVASKDGLVVASDSRQTLDGLTFCDGANKLIEPTRPDRLILAVTGRRGFYPVTIAGARDICDYIRRTPREFDLGEVAKHFLEEDANVGLDSLDLAKLANHCTRALINYLTANPYRMPAASGDHFSSTVVLGSYDPSVQLTVVRSFEILVTPEGDRLVARTGLNERFTSDDLAEPIVVGERDYFVEHVLPTIKDQPISETTRSRLGSFPKVNLQTVGATDLQEAVDMAIDLIESASRMTAIIPATSGIGGPIDVRVLGQGPKAIRLR